MSGEKLTKNPARPLIQFNSPAGPLFRRRVAVKKTREENERHLLLGMSWVGRLRNRIERSQLCVSSLRAVELSMINQEG